MTACRFSLARWALVMIALGAMRLGAAELPGNLAEALSHFRAEGPKGWKFTQTTRSGQESLLEQFDPARPDFKRWTLLEKDGRVPTAEELRVYNETQTRRSSGASAPRIQDQLDLSTAARVESPTERSVWRFQLKPGASDDKTAQFMVAAVTFHDASGSIERVELTNTAPFSPAFGVKIAESRTVMTYSLPTENQPSLLQEVKLHLKGTAFWLKSMDQDMTISYSAQAWAGKKSP